VEVEEHRRLAAARVQAQATVAQVDEFAVETVQMLAQIREQSAIANLAGRILRVEADECCQILEDLWS
jgi:nicotinate-nucleotide pyrophosphorylase